MIARRFTLGQLAAVGWALEQHAQLHTDGESLIGNGVDLRRLTGPELNRHLAQLGA